MSKSDHLNYFAYGSNMSLRRLRARVPAAQALGRGILHGHELRFHKRGRDGSGKCDAFEVENTRARVIGALFSIPQEGKAALDLVEGLGAGYEEKQVSILVGDGDQQHEAVTYYATDIHSDLLPYCWYRQHVLTGAREFELPPHYVEVIANTPYTADPDAGRRLRELAMYT